MEEVKVVIVGAGPSGLATSACLNYLSIPNIVLEKEDCYASLWKKRAYDRLCLHLAKDFCSLPLMSHSASTPTFMPRAIFLEYVDNYVAKFNIKPRFHRNVEKAWLKEEGENMWRVEVRNIETGEMEVYASEFLVVASGENSVANMPEMDGLKTFRGGIVHSSLYKNGRDYEGKDVLVVGCGNSGMEISFDLSNYGARPSIVIRSPMHVVKRKLVYLGMVLRKCLPLDVVDTLLVGLAMVKFGDLSAHGIVRPKLGPMQFKALTGKTPVIDVGTISKIRSGEIKVFPQISNIKGDTVEFENGVRKNFDAIVFATGYKSCANKWLKDYEVVLNERGMPRSQAPNHWKGDKNAYCVGLSMRGLAGVCADAKAVAQDISNIILTKLK
ncbi:putative indole-3-pyruvate monooxygenase YUCCA10, partial [Cucurbita argyrosperma subsp. sororia]